MRAPSRTAAGGMPGSSPRGRPWSAAAGAATALAVVERLDRAGYHVFHAVRADLLRRLGRAGEAAQAYRTAAERTDNAAERAFLSTRAASALAGG
ncbi:hypothetical protein [Micromonospora peucetia]|uniref:hypothetical protein n=1 Tax=Micromonospora peucetia TaxID=47871 RepID=UPI003EB6F4D4